MATPSEITIDTLNGNWILNKKLSSEIDPIFKLQGIKWIFRKAISFTDVCLKISTSYSAGPQTNELITTIEFLQTPSIGTMASTTETRTLDGGKRKHSDYLFGNVTCWSSFVRGSPSAEDVGSVRPVFEVQTKSPNTDVKRFLRGEITPGEGESFTTEGGFLVEEHQIDLGQNQGRGLWVHTFERSVKSDWQAEQVWGFEMIHGHRYFTRRVAVTGADGLYVCGRFVYDFVK